MNTGELVWWIPNGDTPARIRNHPAPQGVDLPNTGRSSHATALVVRSLLMDGEGRSGEPRFHAVDKRTGERVGTIELPVTTDTAPMSFLSVTYIKYPLDRFRGDETQRSGPRAWDRPAGRWALRCSSRAVRPDFFRAPRR